MGEAESNTLRCSFNLSLRVQARDETLTSCAGLLPLRELDQRLAFLPWLADRLHDPRDQDSITHTFLELLRERTFLMALGRDRQGDVPRLAEDLLLRFVRSSRKGLTPREERPASQATHSRLVAMLSSAENLRLLEQNLLEFTRRNLLARRKHRFMHVTLDVDSFGLEVHGRQAGSAGNGYHHMRCYHPIVVMLAESGHLLAARLRPGNVHTADGVVDLLLPLIKRVERSIARVAFVRGDAGFPEERLLGGLEQLRIGYAFRLKTNAVLEKLAAPYLRRPVGRPPKEPREWLYDLSYQAGPWMNRVMGRRRTRRAFCFTPLPITT